MGLVNKKNLQKNIFTLLFILCIGQILGQNIKEQLNNCELKNTFLEHQFDSVKVSLDSLSKNLDSQRVQIDILSKDLNSLKELENCSKISDQYWMNRNLAVSSFNDGTEIKFAQSKAEWDTCFIKKIPAYCFHNEDSLHLNGKLYNIYALNSPKLAPIGYSIPTKSAVEKMINSFGKLQASAALMLKSKELNSWGNPGLDLFNMNFKPDGFRLSDGYDWYEGDKVYFYCETQENEILTFYVLSDFTDKLYFLNRDINSDNVNYGMYVRCLKSK